MAFYGQRIVDGLIDALFAELPAISIEGVRGVGKTTTAPYIDTLERLHILEPLPGWSPTRNPLAKLTSGPKHHLVDPALAAALLGLDAAALLRGESPDKPMPADRTLLGP